MSAEVSARTATTETTAYEGERNRRTAGDRSSAASTTVKPSITTVNASTMVTDSAWPECSPNGSPHTRLIAHAPMHAALTVTVTSSTGREGRTTHRDRQPDLQPGRDDESRCLRRSTRRSATGASARCTAPAPTSRAATNHCTHPAARGRSSTVAMWPPSRGAQLAPTHTPMRSGRPLFYHGRDPTTPAPAGASRPRRTSGGVARHERERGEHAHRAQPGEAERPRHPHDEVVVLLPRRYGEWQHQPRATPRCTRSQRT